jgi:hypothetical protein
MFQPFYSVKKNYIFVHRNKLFYVKNRLQSHYAWSTLSVVPSIINNS